MSRHHSSRRHGSSSRRSVDDRISRSQRDESPRDSSHHRSRHSRSAILSPKSSDRRRTSRAESRRAMSSSSKYKSQRKSSRRSYSYSRSPPPPRSPRRHRSDVQPRPRSESPSPPSTPPKPRRHRSDVGSYRGGTSSYRESSYKGSSHRRGDRSRRSRHYAGDLDDSIKLNEEDEYSFREEDDDYDEDDYDERDRRRHKHSTSRRHGSSRNHRRRSRRSLGDSRRSQSDSPSDHHRRHRSRRERDRSRGGSDNSDHRDRDRDRDRDYYDDDRRYYDEKENKRHRRSRRRRSRRRDPSSSSSSSVDSRRREKSDRRRGSNGSKSRRRARRSKNRRPKRRHSSSPSDRDNRQRDESPMEVAPPRAGVVSEEEELPPSPTEKTKKSESSKTTEKSKDKSTKSKKSASVHDDEVGHFQGGKGSILNEKYSVIQEVGVGTFGRVLECQDLSKSDQHKKQRSRPSPSETVAIKVVRNIKRYYKSARIEADILANVNRKGGRGLSHCVVMHEEFSFDGHYCMVFESLGSSLYDFMKRQRYQPYPPALVFDFAKQLLETLEFIHSFKLIHTDLKPENILLVNDREVKDMGYWVPESTKIKVIDFGGATYDNERKSSIVNTRQYRAPEVILGTGWSMESDMWSAGCILAELYQGELLFATHDNVEHLALIERTIGRFPRWMIERGKQEELIREAFHSDGAHKMERVLEPESLSYVKRIRPLESIVYPEDTWFLSMLQRILVIDPNHRPSARECLNDSKLWAR